MFRRDIIDELEKWAKKEDRMPLVLRGARQVGKTTAVNLFSKGFDQYIYVNLDKDEEKTVFENKYPFKDMLMSLFLFFGKERHGHRTLIFIDEIQNSPKAVALLRYFYEEASDLFVIAAGSLLESILDKRISFPVGRVEYMVLRPVSFKEFLIATGEKQAYDLLEADDIPSYAHDHLTQLFTRYSMIGGMPQIVNNYANNKDLTTLPSLYEGLLTSYSDDVEKYADSNAQIQYIRHILASAFTEACNRITFEKFGNSLYRSRDIKEAFLVLEKTLLFKLVYPVTEVHLPALPNLRLKPRLHAVDTGLVNYSAGMFAQFLNVGDISDVYRGRIAEHIVGQELLTRTNSVMDSIKFWVRDKSQSIAEIDYVLPYNGFLVPIEVKSGSIGKLRSIHQFIEKAPNVVAIRVWQGPFSVEKAKNHNGKEFTLINLPFYMVHRIQRVLLKYMV